MLTGFPSGARGASLIDRLNHVSDLPEACLRQVEWCNTLTVTIPSDAIAIPGDPLNRLFAGDGATSRVKGLVFDEDRREAVVQEKNHAKSEGNPNYFYEWEFWADGRHLKQDGCENAEHQS